MYTPKQCIGLLAGALALCCVSAPAAAQLVLLPDTVSSPQGSQIDYRLWMTNFTDLISVQGTWAWDTAVARFVSTDDYVLPGMTGQNMDLSQVDNGWVGFSWWDATLNGVTLSDTNSLFTLRLEIVGDPGTECEVWLFHTPVVWEVIDNNQDQIPIIDDLNGSILLILQRFPPNY